MRHKLIQFFLLIVSPALMAEDISSHMNQFVQSGGVSVNVTEASAFKGQAAGGYTLGSVSLRHPTRSYTPIMAQAPGMRMGCGGIDLFTGSFSYISSDELKRAFRNIGTSMGTYGVMIALESACPMCKKQVDQLHRMANEINRFNINSCETAAGIVGGLWPRTETAQRHVCTTAGGPGGLFNDFAAAKQKCGSGGESQRVFDEIRQASQKKNNNQSLSERERKLASFEDMLLDKGNLAWMILTKTGFTKEHGQPLTEMVMSLSGSLILDNSNDTNVWRLLPSKAGDEALLNTLLYGEIKSANKLDGKAAAQSLDAKVYHCDTSELYGCLNPNLVNFRINHPQSWVGRIQETLRSIQDKARLDQELTAQEKDLISSAKFPLFRAINVQSAYSFARDVVNLSDYAEILALDILEEYLEDLLDVVKFGSHRIQADAETLKEFQAGIAEARGMIRYFRSNNQKKITQAHDMVRRVQFLEQQLVGEFDADMLRTIDYTSGRR
ncbi:conjugal transfer protein TraH [Candidatus Berkiella aquae]|uniref:Conjugal transfer protein TraH n=1 Tax=Candidatus Berkiella aquae TaxID=295108 RepID=A0A0Q9YTL1_9GAMM|nr:conjugal transfer protein TraH [Candidatus Berkiella aquae]MCS5712772.1 conjugal transfer protein TraH [Candidatus Berkiella aquae]